MTMKESSSLVGSIPSRSYFKEAFHKKYLECLNLYWNGSTEECLEKIHSVIKNHIEKDSISLFYRLWIEVLSEKEDRVSLDLLKNHFISLGSLSEQYDMWLSLRGLVHFELEEMEACSLLLRALQDSYDNPYAMELKQRFELRKAENPVKRLSILDCKSPLEDYIVLQSSCRSMLENGDFNTLFPVLKKMSSTFMKSPLEAEFLFWKFFEDGDFEESIEIGKHLVLNFPKKENYSFDLAFVYFCNNEIDESIRFLESIIPEEKSKDPDLYSLLGYAYLFKAEGPSSEEWKQGKKCFERALTHGISSGVPVHEILLFLNFIKNKEDKIPIQSESRNYWKVLLSPRRESELFDGDSTETDYLFYNLNKDVSKNDLVFLVKSEEKKTQVFAVYKVLRSQVWSPYQKNLSMMELVAKFEKSVETQHPQSLVDPCEAIPSEEAELWLALIEDSGFPIHETLKISLKKEEFWKQRGLKVG